MSLLITKAKKGGIENKGRHFNYYRRRKIYSLVTPTCSQEDISYTSNVSRVSKDETLDGDQNENENENVDHNDKENQNESELHDEDENENENEPINADSLRNNYYASLTSLQEGNEGDEGDEGDEDLDGITDSHVATEDFNSDAESAASQSSISKQDTPNKTNERSGPRWIDHKRTEFAKRKLLVPKKPVWHESRCHRFDNWKNLYRDEIDDICEYTSNFFSYLIDNGYDIRVNETDLHYRLTSHMYRTSTNVKTTFIMNK